ncbi:hypothetical protein CTJ15_16770 [Roseomonas sp. FDAARGOS_362]|uniref:ATP-grasp domain-containing protein n=1 Tax=Roseomonas TaxID=125216 RepID=UPI00096A4FB2|nr:MULTISPECIES: ATP-grasp domain-containing protein [Roseomonas]ATR21791.1 hypothetical protein CTJ15_16770 [Roseomonas sp. FDAARGOS_362]
MPYELFKADHVAQACEMLGLTFTSSSVVSIARDKVATRAALKAHGFTMPRYAAAAAVDQIPAAVTAIGLPCIVKPARGSGSRVCYPLYNDEQVDWYQAEARRVQAAAQAYMQWIFANGFICEEVLKGPILSVCVAAGHRNWHAVSVALHAEQAVNPSVGFGSVLPISPEHHAASACADYAVSVCEALDLSVGLFDAEMVFTESGPVLLEVNARPMGGEMIAAYELATGHDLFGTILDIYAGREFSTPTAGRGPKTVIRKLIAAEQGQVASSLDHAALLKLIPAGVMLKNYRLYQGRHVHELEVLARLLMTAGDEWSGFAHLGEVAECIAAAAGVRLIDGSLPDLPLMVVGDHSCLHLPEGLPSSSGRALQSGPL